MTQRYLGMTQLPEELERTLIRFPYSTLIKILRSKTKISGTDTSYSAVQWISRELSTKEVEKAIELYKADLDKEEVSPLYTLMGVRPQESASTSAPAAPRVKVAPSGNSHPQSVINAKIAVAKAAGGLIRYSRESRGWDVIKANAVATVWSSEIFREITEDRIKEYISST